MQAWNDFEQQHKDRFLDELLDLLRIPSVSARSEHKADPLDVPLPVSIDPDLAVNKLLDIKADVDAPAADAFVDLEAEHEEVQEPTS